MTIESGASGAGADDLDLFEAEATGKPVTTTSPTIPEKYAGKSVDDLIKMHQNAEQALSRQGQELGTVRKLADEIIGLKKPTTQVTEERVPVTVDQLLNDPEKAIRDAVAHSDVGRRAEHAEQRVATLEANITERDFVSKHPDFASDINDPSFLEWVNKNPLRGALAARAASKDYTAATPLWDMWAEHKELVSAAGGKPASAPSDRKTVPTTVKASPSENTRGAPVYSRAKIMELKVAAQQGHQPSIARLSDPGFQEKLNKAYADGRVR